MSNTRVKINLSEGTIELEGSETFIEKHWDEVKSILETTPKPNTGTNTKTNNSKPKKQTKSGTSPKTIDLQLIPLNLKGDPDKPSLKDFVTQKSPKSQQEVVTSFAYYLKKYLKIDNMKPGHALYCYTEIGKKKPLNIIQLFRDTTSLKGWLSSGSESNTAKITIGGENLIEHDLPHNQKN